MLVLLLKLKTGGQLSCPTYDTSQVRGPHLPWHEIIFLDLLGSLKERGHLGTKYIGSIFNKMSYPNQQRAKILEKQIYF